MNSNRITRVTLDEARRMKGKTDYARFDAMSDDDIARAVESDPTMAPIGSIDWDKVSLVIPPTAKDVITLRLDHDVLDWLRSTGKGYQTRINQVLRAWYEASQREAELSQAARRAAPKPETALQKARAKRAAKKAAAKRPAPAKKRA
jgi:uncharacterized protein (DUF4415 family)